MSYSTDTVGLVRNSVFSVVFSVVFVCVFVGVFSVVDCFFVARFRVPFTYLKLNGIYSILSPIGNKMYHVVLFHYPNKNSV